jgi:hypothetical protein
MRSRNSKSAAFGEATPPPTMDGPVPCAREKRRLEIWVPKKRKLTFITAGDPDHIRRAGLPSSLVRIDNATGAHRQVQSGNDVARSEVHSSCFNVSEGHAKSRPAIPTLWSVRGH